MENSIFTKLAATGTLSADFFHVGAGAADLNDFIIYDDATGALSYDSNGSASGPQVQFAHLDRGLALTPQRLFRVSGLLKAGRPPASRSAPGAGMKLAADGAAEGFSSMIAYAGTYKFDGKTIEHHIDLSWNEVWSATMQARDIKKDGDRLIQHCPRNW